MEEQKYVLQAVAYRYGVVVERVAAVLMRCGPQTLDQLVAKSELPEEKVAHVLLVLSRQDLLVSTHAFWILLDKPKLAGKPSAAASTTTLLSVPRTPKSKPKKPKKQRSDGNEDDEEDDDDDDDEDEDDAQARAHEQALARRQHARAVLRRRRVHKRRYIPVVYGFIAANVRYSARFAQYTATLIRLLRGVRVSFTGSGGGGDGDDDASSSSSSSRKRARVGDFTSPASSSSFSSSSSSRANESPLAAERRTQAVCLLGQTLLLTLLHHGRLTTRELIARAAAELVGRSGQQPTAGDDDSASAAATAGHGDGGAGDDDDDDASAGVGSRRRRRSTSAAAAGRRLDAQTRRLRLRLLLVFRMLASLRLVTPVEPRITLHRMFPDHASIKQLNLAVHTPPPRRSSLVTASSLMSSSAPSLASVRQQERQRVVMAAVRRGGGHVRPAGISVDAGGREKHVGDDGNGGGGGGGGGGRVDPFVVELTEKQADQALEFGEIGDHLSGGGDNDGDGDDDDGGRTAAATPAGRAKQRRRREAERWRRLHTQPIVRLASLTADDDSCLWHVHHTQFLHHAHVSSLCRYARHRLDDTAADIVNVMLSGRISTAVTSSTSSWPVQRSYEHSFHYSHDEHGSGGGGGDGGDGGGGGGDRANRRSFYLDDGSDDDAGEGGGDVRECENSEVALTHPPPRSAARVLAALRRLPAAWLHRHRPREVLDDGSGRCGVIAAGIGSLCGGSTAASASPSSASASSLGVVGGGATANNVYASMSLATVSKYLAEMACDTVPLVAALSAGDAASLYDDDDAWTRRHPRDASPVYRVRVRALFHTLRLRHVQQVVLSRFGVYPARVWRLLCLHHRMEEDELAASATLPVKATRAHLFALLRAGYANLQEIPKTAMADRQPGRVMYLWGVPSESLYVRVRDSQFQAARNLLTRLQQHQTRVNALLSERNTRVHHAEDEVDGDDAGAASTASGDGVDSAAAQAAAAAKAVQRAEENATTMALTHAGAVSDRLYGSLASLNDLQLLFVEAFF